MKGCVFLFDIRNPLSCCTKFREELKFKVLYGFPLANSLEKRREKTKRKKEQTKKEQKQTKKGIMKRSLALLGL